MKIVVLDANNIIGQLIVKEAENNGIVVTSIVQSPTNLVGSGPVIVSDYNDLDSIDFSKYYALIDPYSIFLNNFNKYTLFKLASSLNGTNCRYIMLADCSLLCKQSQEHMQDIASFNEDKYRAFEKIKAMPDLNYTFICPPLIFDNSSYSTAKFEFTKNKVAIGLDGSSIINNIDYVKAIIEILKLKDTNREVLSVRGIK